MLHVLWLASPTPSGKLIALMQKTWGNKTRVLYAPTLSILMDIVFEKHLDLIFLGDHFLSTPSFEAVQLFPKHLGVTVLLTKSAKHAIEGLRLNFDHCFSTPLSQKELLQINPTVGRWQNETLPALHPYLMCASYHDPNAYHKIPLENVVLIRPNGSESVVHTIFGRAVESNRSTAQILLQLNPLEHFYCTAAQEIININHLNAIQHFGPNQFWCKLDGNHFIEIGTKEKKQLLEYIQKLETL